jgi:hypothetical protein
MYTHAIIDPTTIPHGKGAAGWDAASLLGKKQ